ncbi:P63C domain-containing protein [Mycolicibacterium elephantis]
MVSKHSDASSDTDKSGGKRAGGIARAKNLTPEQRSAIARDAAQQRWSAAAQPVVAGSADRQLSVGGVDIECYVVEDGTRLITQASFMRAIGRTRFPSGGRAADDALPLFLRSQSLRPYISDEIIEASQPVLFQRPGGGRAYGYRAELLPDVCELYLKAREAMTLPPSQEHIARQAEIVVRGLAQVGIIALVDEVTGYQEVRARDALAKILEAYVDKELQAWVRTFPADYYEQIFRLKGLDYPHDSVKRPQYFGHVTNDIVYKRIAPGVLDELKRVQRKGSSGKPKDKLFQRLTTNRGYPQLREHLGSVVTMMKMSPDWRSFMEQLDRIHPRFNETIPMDFDELMNEKGL